MKTKNRFCKQLLPGLISLVMLIGLLPVLPVMADISDPINVEVFLAADPASNNLSLDGFESALKSDLQTRYGYPSDKVYVTSVESQDYDTSAIDWYEFDHTNNSGLAASSTTSVISYDAENYANLVRDRHIVFSNAGQTIDLFGYGVEPYRDFLYTPDSTANNKVFTFSMNEAAISYHTLMMGGFLFNASYSYDAGTGERMVSGYVVGVAEGSIVLYQINNMSVADLTSGAGATVTVWDAVTWQYYIDAGYLAADLNSWGYYLEGTQPQQQFQLLCSVSKPASVNNFRYLKLVASPTEVSLYQFTDDTYATTTTGGKLLESYQLPANYGSFGYGPFAAYNSHDCSQLTQLTFSNLTLSTNTSTNFTDLVRSIDWQFADSLKLIVNVDNDGVKEFGSASAMGTILYYLGLNNAHYAGWGINNVISIGSDTTVMGQAASFIARNRTKGFTINRSDAATNSQSEGVAAISDYILDQYNNLCPIDPPNTRLTFGAGGAIQIEVTDTETSAENPIGAYQWRYMDIASGTWQTSDTAASTANFNFGSGTYNMVTVKIKDAASGLWSDDKIAYIANDSSVQPIAQFTLNHSELMPDTSIADLNTGWTATAEDLSYHPAGETITAWDWKVYDHTLTEIPALASSIQNPTFNFTGRAAGQYTVKLRVQKGSIWSSYYSQAITIYLESSQLAIARTTPAGAGPFLLPTGGSSFAYTITSSSNPISRYRLLFINAAGTLIAGSWQAAGSTTVNGTGSVSDAYDVYVQAIDSTGNSKSVLIGSFYKDLVKPVLSLNTHGYTSGTWTHQEISLTVANTAANLSPVTLQRKIDSGAWVTCQDSLPFETIISTNSNYQLQFRAISDGGTVSDIISTHVKFDNVTPALTVNGNPTQYTASAALSLIPSDCLSGVSSLTVQKDGGTVVDLSSSFSEGYIVAENGHYIFTMTSAAGLTCQAVADVTMIDPLQPVINLNSNGYVNGSWTSHPVTIQVSNQAANLGTSTYEYSMDNGAWTFFNGTLTHTAEGVHEYRFRTASAAGLVSAAGAITVKLDTTLPQAPAISFTPLDDGLVYQFLNFLSFRQFFNDRVQVTLTAADSGSGIASFIWQAGSATPVQVTAVNGSATFELPASFKSTIQASACDAVGLVSAATHADGVVVDKVSPTITYQQDTANAASEFGLTFACNDTDAGIWKILSQVGRADAATRDLAASAADPVYAQSVDLIVPDSGLTVADYDVRLSVIDLTGNQKVLDMNILAAFVNAKISDLPDPATAASDAITVAAGEIRDAKRLFDLLTREQKNNELGTVQIQKLEDLLGRLTNYIVINNGAGTGSEAANDPETGNGNGNSIGNGNGNGNSGSNGNVTPPAVIIQHIGTSVIIPELADPDTQRVSISIKVEVVDSDNLDHAGFILTAAETLADTSQAILETLDLSLIQTVIRNDGSSSSAKVDNSNIAGPLLVQIPLPEEYVGYANLHIAYIDDTGAVTHLDTTLVTINGQRYLQFETDHFSSYAIIGDEPVPSTGEASPVLPLALILAAITFLFISRKRLIGKLDK